MNEAGYFPVPRPPTAAWGRISRVHRTWIQRWVNDSKDFPKATFLGNIRRQRGIYRQTHIQSYSCTLIAKHGHAPTASNHAKHGKMTNGMFPAVHNMRVSHQQR